MTVKELIEELRKTPPDLIVTTFLGGEITGCEINQEYFKIKQDPAEPEIRESVKLI